MVDLEKFKNDCVAAMSFPDYAERIQQHLQDLMKDPAALKAALPEIEIEDYLLLQNDQISIYHIRFMPGVAYPTHNHGMDVVSGIYEGVETNRFYQETPDGKLSFIKEQSFRAGDTEIVRNGILHDARNDGNIPSLGFHIHLGNFYGTEHFLWSKSGEKFPYSDKKFVELATYPPGYPIPEV